MQRIVDGIKLECSFGNIVLQNGFSALAIPASPGLAPGMGLAGAVHAIAGEEMYQDCIAKSGANYPGQVILTSGYRLKIPWVLHCLVPQRIRDARSARQLADCYRNALLMAEEHELNSVAFATLARGSFSGQDAIEIALGALRGTIPKLRRLQRIRLVFGSREAWLKCQEMMTHSESA